jgi:hypothetical protein
MLAYLLISHIVRVLEFIHAAVLAPEVADVGYEQNGLERSLATEQTGTEKPQAQIKEFLHIIQK